MLSNVLKRVVSFCTVAVLLFACRPAHPPVPGDTEIYNLLLDQLKQTAKASGFLKYRLKINKLQRDTAAGTCTTQDHDQVICFHIKVDRTESLDNYDGTYTTTYTGDEYHLYRDEYGHLAIVDHVAGSTTTSQDHHPDMTRSL